MIVQRAMGALAIVERFDVVEDLRSGLGVGAETAAIDQFQVEGAPGAFHGGVGIAVASAAHGGYQAGIAERLAIIAAGVLDAAIGMEQQLGRRQRCNSAMARAFRTRTVSMRSLMAQPTILRL